MSGADHSSATNPQDKSDTDEFEFTLVDAKNATLTHVSAPIRPWRLALVPDDTHVSTDSNPEKSYLVDARA
jgi:hypothetical protein